MLQIREEPVCDPRRVAVAGYPRRAVNRRHAYPSNPLPLHQTGPHRDKLNFLDRHWPELKDRLRIAVVFSGNKETPGAVLYRAPNTRPWKSYEEVASDIRGTLREAGFRHVDLFPDDMGMIDNLRRGGTQFVWLNTGGVQGDNPVCHAAAVLEMLGIPYVGHNPLNASLLDEKDAFKRSLQSLGIPTAPFVRWHPAAAGPLPRRLARVFGDCRGPFVVKPVSGRASLHVHVVGDAAELPAVVEEVYSVTQKAVLIEEYLPGREFCVAVAGPVVHRRGRFEHLAGPFAFSALERRLGPGEAIFTSMDRKAITEDRACLVPASESRLRRELTDLARQIYREFDLTSLVRIDVRADADGHLHVLEANPKPDLKRPGEGKTSLVSIGLAEQGMTYPDLILGLLADRITGLVTYSPSRVEHILPLVS